MKRLYLQVRRLFFHFNNQIEKVHSGKFLSVTIQKHPIKSGTVHQSNHKKDCMQVPHHVDFLYSAGLLDCTSEISTQRNALVPYIIVT